MQDNQLQHTRYNNKTISCIHCLSIHIYTAEMRFMRKSMQVTEEKDPNQHLANQQGWAGYQAKLSKHQGHQISRGAKGEAEGKPLTASPSVCLFLSLALLCSNCICCHCSTTTTQKPVWESDVELPSLLPVLLLKMVGGSGHGTKDWVEQVIWQGPIHFYFLQALQEDKQEEVTAGESEKACFLELYSPHLTTLSFLSQVFSPHFPVTLSGRTSLHFRRSGPLPGISTVYSYESGEWHRRHRQPNMVPQCKKDEGR